MGLMEAVIDIPAEHEGNVFGQFDAFAKKIERTLHVTLIARGESVKIMGEAANVEKAKKVLSQLVGAVEKGQHDPGTECGLYPCPCHGGQQGEHPGD